MGVLIDLCDEHVATPAMVRWLRIQPSGRVSERQSDNRVTYVETHKVWLQWALRRDVGREVDPENALYGPIVVMVSTEGHGVVVVARHDDRPNNPTATAMLRAVGIAWRVRGTAAWIGDLDPETGLYGDLGDTRLAALRSIAAHCRI